ncbi:MAG: 16S rRNA (guanine(966)-N(2))-methyltransferase RsmD [Proteobacteria bacterium]|nr:16S rRNA (guanine(966)-N(2))-methyltransferase RsmD [Pseudomonadota bacterium]
MRITSGDLKGRVLKLSSKFSLRPSSEKLREALFSTLGSFVELEKSNFLDLFAGSGAVGIEAISRGADTATFVEQEKDLVENLKSNLDILGIKDRAVVKKGRAEKAVSDLNSAYRIIFADPPYRYQAAENLLDSIIENNLVTEESIFIFESESSKTIEIKNNFHSYSPVLLKEKIYGDSKLTYIGFKANDK